MCGIVGYLGSKPAKPVLLQGLKKLEYRGYDSAGISLVDEDKQKCLISRSVGFVDELAKKMKDVGFSQTIGIAHTRWATHGVPSERNAHPHRSKHLVLVHNGILENHNELRNLLKEQGFDFSSQTDTEVIVSWLSTIWEEGFQNNDKFKQEIVANLNRLDGQFSFLFVDDRDPNTIFGIQKGAPLLIAKGDSGWHIGSDQQALIEYSNMVSAIDNNIFFQLKRDSDVIEAFDLETLKDWKPSYFEVKWNNEMTQKHGYETFMLKEIFEQPSVIANSLSGRLPTNERNNFLWDQMETHTQLWKGKTKIYLVACGTAFYAAMVAKYYFEKWSGCSVDVDLASEFRYRSPVFDSNTLVGVISQSGETADTLAALRLANESGVQTFAVCNVPGSTIFREASFSYMTKAGPEIGVASTKAFTSQLAILCSLALDLAGINNTSFKDLVLANSSYLARLPHDLSSIVQREKEFQEIGKLLGNYKTILFVGRGIMYPIALEGALKTKEITYRHAEGYAAGELKHGPIALVDDKLVTIVLAPSDHVMSKTLSNLEEIKARGGVIIGIGEEGNTQFKDLCKHYIPMPKLPWAVTPIAYTIPCQLLAYGLAKACERNIDRPRNLAKSVTVE